MKNKLIKFITGSFLALILLQGVAGAQTTTAMNNIPQVDNSSMSSWDGQYGTDRGMMDTGNWYPQREARFHSEHNWDGIMPSFVAGFLGLGIVFSLIAVLAVLFWLWMLVHAATHDIKHKPVWLLVIWFMHIFGAVIYFFVVKRKLDKGMCGCGCQNGGGCACGGACMCADSDHEEHDHHEHHGHHHE